MTSGEVQSDFLPEICFGKIGVLKVHQISEDELNSLEQGAGESLFLNIGIGVLSVSTSFLIALLTTTIESGRTFDVFVIVTLVGFLAGVVLMAEWCRTRKSIKKLAKKIRDRMPPEGEAYQLFPQCSGNDESDIVAAVDPRTPDGK